MTQEEIPYIRIENGKALIQGEWVRLVLEPVVISELQPNSNTKTDE